MKIYELCDRQPFLGSLTDVWEKSVRATHLFLTDDEILKLKEYVPTALAVFLISLLPKATERLLLSWAQTNSALKCCLSFRNTGAGDSEHALFGSVLKNTA